MVCPETSSWDENDSDPGLNQTLNHTSPSRPAALFTAIKLADMNISLDALDIPQRTQAAMVLLAVSC